MKIEIEHVSKKIKDALVLDDVCMTLESGNIYGFKGVNGSGKTMLMRAVSGLMYPTSGTISIDGKVLGKNMAFPERIGMLIENPAFIDSYTGYDNLKMLASINKGEVDISRALETVGAEPSLRFKSCCISVLFFITLTFFLCLVGGFTLLVSGGRYGRGENMQGFW